MLAMLQYVIGPRKPGIKMRLMTWQAPSMSPHRQPLLVKARGAGKGEKQDGARDADDHLVHAGDTVGFASRPLALGTDA